MELGLQAGPPKVDARAVILDSGWSLCFVEGYWSAGGQVLQRQELVPPPSVDMIASQWSESVLQLQLHRSVSYGELVLMSCQV